MHSKRNVTEYAFNTLQEKWADKVNRSYETLETAREIVSFLKDDSYCNNFAFEVTRYLQDRYGTLQGEHCMVCVDDLSVSVSPYNASVGTEISDTERKIYLKVIMKLVNDSGIDEKLLSRRDVRDYFIGNRVPGRDKLFRLSFALGMDWEETNRFLDIMGEAPYRFRVLTECVFFFCQSSTKLRHWSDACEILERYRNEMAKDSEEPLSAGQSQLLEWELTILAEKIDDIENREEQIDCIVKFLRENAWMMHGFSLSTHELFCRKLDTVKELLGVKTDEKAAVAMWSDIWVQYLNGRPEKGTTREKPEEESDREPGKVLTYQFIPFEKIVDLPPTLYEKPLMQERVKKLREGSEPVEKRDILFLLLMEWIWSGEDWGGKESLQRFIVKANSELMRVGFEKIYLPNRYDRMILLAVCSDDPIGVLAGIFEVSTEESVLQQKVDEWYYGKV